MANELNKNMNLVMLQSDNRPEGLTVFGNNGEMIFLNNENMFFFKNDVFSVKPTNSKEADSLSLSAIEYDERAKYSQKLERENRLRRKLKL